MKIFYQIIFMLMFLSTAFSQKQNEIRVSMGIDFISVPELKDYLEANYTDRLSDFSSAVNFSGSYGMMLGQTSQLEVELGYLLNSYNANSTLGNYDLTYSLVMPSVLYNYVIAGNGYNFKFGGGAGIRLLSAEEKLPSDPNKYNFSSTGFGMILRAAGNTALAKDVFAHVAADIRYDVIAKPDENSEPNHLGNVNFSSLSFGIRLGISYQF